LDRRIDDDPKVQIVARRLGVRVRKGLRFAIQDAAEARVRGWMNEFSLEPSSLSDVHLTTLNRLRLKVHQVKSDRDFHRIGSRLRTEMPNLPQQLELEFGERDTEALLMRRRSGSRSGRYVAVIDARGDRVHRAWYAERHEASHLLIEDPSTDHVWRRSGDSAPIERVVDAVAARVGFWPDLVRPLVQAADGGDDGLLKAFGGLRQEVAPDASMEASFRAFARYLEYPALLLYCDLGARKGEQSKGAAASSYALRVRSVVWSSTAASHNLFIPHNYRIPKHSVIHEAGRAGPGKVFIQDDRLGRWTSSGGRRLADVPVQVEARGRWALLTLR